MQLMKSYEGALEFSSAATNRRVSFGVDNTISCIQDKVNFVNQAIAQFLHDDCGVDAVYEVREGSPDPFLWINHVPFLFAATGTSTAFALYGPLYAASIMTGGTNAAGATYSVFFNGTTGTYSFSLYFSGDPETAFALRLKGYHAAAVSLSFLVRFIRARNVLNQKNAMVWVFGNALSGSVVSGANGIDLDANGQMEPDSFSSETLKFYPNLLSKAVQKSANPGKLPLVPLMFGVWQSKGVFLLPDGFGLPAAAMNNVEQQTEIEISGRRFFVTSSSPVAVNYVNLGLVEAT